MKSFSKQELIGNLPKTQKLHSEGILNSNPEACMICGVNKGRQILLNGLPSQLCDDCIEIQVERKGSEMQEICGNCLHPISLNAQNGAYGHLSNGVRVGSRRPSKTITGSSVSNQCGEDNCSCHEPIVWKENKASMS